LIGHNLPLESWPGLNHLIMRHASLLCLPLPSLRTKLLLHPLRWYSCECLAALVCWRLFFCLEVPPSVSGFIKWQPLRWYGCCKCLAMLVCWRLFSCLKAPPSASAYGRLPRLSTDSIVRLRVSCDACLLASFLLPGSPSLCECLGLINRQPIRWYGCWCLVTLVCWRLFCCTGALP
jgi:hypothetical protein